MHQISKGSQEESKKLRDERSEKESNFQVFGDVDTFRKRMPLYPDYYSHL